MRRIGSAAAVAVFCIAAVRTASAQLPGVPYMPVETGLGVSVAADYGMPDDDFGGGSAYALTGGIGFSRFGASVSVGGAKPDGFAEAEISYGGRLGMKLFGGGLNPLTVGAQVGVSSVSYDLGALLGTQRSTAVLPAAWVRVSPPLFPLKPFGQVYYVTGDNVEEEARFTIGANFNFLLGLGVHAAYDWGNSGATIGVGAHFNFRVPGMPGVPGI